MIDIPLQRPFRYVGGTLCIEVSGTPTPGDEAGWWPIDGAVDAIEGSVDDVGESCANHGSNWNLRQAFVSASTHPGHLVPGSTAGFHAFGDPGSIGALLIGFRSADVDLGALGVGEPGCRLYVLDTLAIPTTYPAVPHPRIDHGAAIVRLAIPPRRNLFGATFRAQFVESGTRLRTSNALDCRLSTRFSSLGMCTVRGHVWQMPRDHGIVDSRKAPVIRIR